MSEQQPATQCPHPVAEWVLAADDAGAVSVTCGRCEQPVSLDEDDDECECEP